MGNYLSWNSAEETPILQYKKNINEEMERPEKCENNQYCKGTDDCTCRSIKKTLDAENQRIDKILGRV